MSNFQQPDIIWIADRSYKDSKQRIQLERGEYQGQATYALRLMWKTPDGQWRWNQAKPASSGKTWASLNLKSRELASLGKLLLAEAAKEQPALAVDDDGELITAPRPCGPPRASYDPHPGPFPGDDSIPF